MKHSGKIKVNYSVICIVLLLCFVLSLIPILILSNYSAPFADDFSFSCETHAAVQAGEPVLRVLQAAVGKVIDVYYTWQGTFSGIFLMAFQPGIFGLQAYRWTAWIMLASLCAGVFFLFSAILSGLLGHPRSVSILSASAVLVICIQLMPSANQGLYWYNGAVYYTFTFGITLIAYAIAARYAVKGGFIRILILFFLSLIIGGSNYVTALLTSIIFLFLTVSLLISKNRRWKGYILPLFAVVISLALSAAAPGNSVRQAEFPDSPNAITAVLLSFKAAAFYCLKWISLPYIGMLIFIALFIWRSSEKSDIKFQHAVLCSLFFFCIFSSMFTPHYYAEGTAGPDRLINILFYSFVILSALNLSVWCIAFRNYYNRKKVHTEYSPDSISVIPVIAVSAAFVLSFGIGIISGNIHPTSVMALGELKNGEAETYYREISDRQIVLEDNSIQDCVFDPIVSQPYLLFSGDMSADPSDYTNEDACSFYHKKSIIIHP
ncbi:MAG: DUF6056 family protein [Eubacteriales bacterium]|nr:DUF6056 family protein [Eubacteriales bacterium]